jgi:hypothetical protein
LAAGLGLSLAALLLLGEGGGQATSFNPAITLCLEDAATAAQCDGSAAAGAVTDVRSTFEIAAPEPNFAQWIDFVPDGFLQGTSGNTPIGAIVGTLSASKVSLGLINGPCTPFGSVNFTLLNASVDDSDTISPRPPGEAHVLEPLAADLDFNGVPDGADKYPSYLNVLFPGPPPVARAVGFAYVQGEWWVLNLLRTDSPGPGSPFAVVRNDPTAPPGQSVVSDFCSPLQSINITYGLTRDNLCTPAPGPSGCPQLPPPTCGVTASGPEKTDSDGDGKINDGCPQVAATPETGAQCDNNISDDPEDPDVNDGCPQVGAYPESFLPDPDGCDADTNEASCILRKNPAAGTYTFTTLSRSQYDMDGDGHENSLDVCFDIPNPNWKPRATDPVDDPDNDGLPSECDPNPNAASPSSPQLCPVGNTGPDEDQDCYSNRQDNCPLIANSQADADRDGIGDACDPNPGTPDGHFHELCLPVELTIPSSPVGSVKAAYSPPCAAAAVPTPTATPRPVGGIVELRAGSAGPAAEATGSAGRDNVRPLAAAVAAAAGLSFAAGVWYARRRWLR